MEPDEELALVVDTARKVSEVELVPRLRAAESSRTIEPDLKERWEEVGLSGLDLPESSDGAGLGALARVLVNEELAAGDVGAAIALDAFGPAMTALLEVGGEAAVEKLVSILAETRAPAEGRAILVSEHDAQLEVRSDEIDIDAPWVSAESASAVVVLRGEDALLVTEGIELEPTRGAGLRAAGAARLVVRSAPIAGRWSNAEGAIRALARARLYYASLLLGVLRASCEFSAAYSQEREAFGKPIGHHQALAFLITEMRMALDAARFVVHEAAWRVDQCLPCAMEAASAWAECIEASRMIGPQGVQILGGHGFMADYPVEKHMREARALGLMCGGFDRAIEDAGQLLIQSDSPLALGIEGAL